MIDNIILTVRLQHYFFFFLFFIFYYRLKVLLLNIIVIELFQFFSQLIEVLLLIYCQYSFPNSEPRFYFQNSLKIVVSKYNIILPFRVKTTSEKIAIFINNNKSNLGSQNSHNSPRYITWFFFFMIGPAWWSHFTCQLSNNCTLYAWLYLRNTIISAAYKYDI